MERHFSKDILMAHKHGNKCSASLVTVKMQIKTTLRRYHLPPGGWLRLKTPGTSAGEDAEKLKSICVADGNGKGNSCGKWHGDSSKKKIKKINKKYDVLQQFHCWVSIYPKARKANIQTNTCTLMFRAAVPARAKRWRKPRMDGE